MSDAARIDTFLAGTVWRDWHRQAMAGDASSRRYLRLTGPEGATAILMDADPATGEDVAPFLSIARWLSAQGLTAPRLLHGEIAEGLLLIEDLGADTVAVATATTPEEVLYDAAVDVLVHLDGCAPPAGLKVMTPAVAADMVEITARHYHPCDPEPLMRAVADAMTALAPQADRPALRDYHAENLIWRPARTGLDRVGLLDFQDAFVAPQGYDLASLLRDIRRDVGPDQMTRQTRRFAAAVGADHDALCARLAILGAQRNLRILGVFARLAAQGRPRYGAMLPAVWTALTADLAHPALADLRTVVLSTLPAPQDRR